MAQLPTFFTIADAITPETHARVLEVARRTSYVDGSCSAGRWEGHRKRNTQAPREAIQPICKAVMSEIMTNRELCDRALPHEAVQPMLNRYRPGDGYGPHEDSPIQSGIRADLSFTLFLAEPSTYEGGELLLGDGDAAVPIRLPARALVCYPSGTLHEVRPIRSGERLAMVGWMQSIVRDAGQRSLFYEVRRTTDALATRGDRGDAVATLSRVYGALLRRWALA